MDVYERLAAYYKTESWKNKRREVLRERPFCQINHNHPGPLHVHHASYARLGREAEHDLIVLCSKCHMKCVHDEREEDDLLWGAP